LTNTVTEIVAKDNAHVDHVRLELESDNGLHVANLQAALGKSSTFISQAFTLGGLFVRNDISAHLRGEGCEATINGLCVLEGTQHVDNYTLLEHAEPHCPSHELYKGILGGSSRSVFRGKIHVHQKAQHTDAYQRNENILLSDNARINTKPQLEIYADEVKCSHGATVGQLDENALFYLRARGIPEPESRRILLRAFADDVVDRVKLEPVRAHLNDLIDAKLERIYKKETA
jgi:Fe-S cluster assembly protein SufD